MGRRFSQGLPSVAARSVNLPSTLPLFAQVDQGTLFELILAANYLDIKGLLDVTCKTVANMIKGEEIS